MIGILGASGYIGRAFVKELVSQEILFREYNRERDDYYDIKKLVDIIHRDEINLSPEKQTKTSKESAKLTTQPKPATPSESKNSKPIEIKEKSKTIIKQPTKTKKETTSFNNPLVIQEKTKPKKEKPKSDFVQKIISILNNNYQIIEEKEYKPKEYNCLLKIKSELGPISFLTQAKDKKSISETDLKKLLSTAQSIPLPALFIYTGKLSKKATEFAEKYFSVIKLRKIS